MVWTNIAIANVVKESYFCINAKIRAGAGTSYKEEPACQKIKKEDETIGAEKW